MKNFLKKIIILLLSLIIIITFCSMDSYKAHEHMIINMSINSAASVLKSEETKINYSNTIHVLVTTKQKEVVQNQLKDMNEEIKMLAKVIYREARGESKEYQSAVAWCVLNRVDSPRYGSTIKKVITSPNQFAWYPNTPLEKRFLKLAKDVVTRWLLEKEGYEEVGRTLPSDYFFFSGDGVHNYFRKNFKSTTYYDWSLESPYE